MQLTKNFKLQEFGTMPHPTLLSMLQVLRDRIGKPITIESGARSFQEHAEIYKEIYKECWAENLTLNSAHLPSFDNEWLWGVDISSQGTTSSELKAVLLAIRNVCFPSVKVGIGVGNNVMHFDVKRIEDEFWWY